MNRWSCQETSMYFGDDSYIELYLHAIQTPSWHGDIARAVLLSFRAIWREFYFNTCTVHLLLFCTMNHVSKKVKYTLVQALRFCTGRTAHRGNRGMALLFLDHGTRRGEGSVSRPSRSLPPGKTRYPLYRRLGGSQGRSGQVRKISPPPEFDPRTVQPIASPCTYYATRPTMNHVRAV